METEKQRRPKKALSLAQHRAYLDRQIDEHLERAVQMIEKAETIRARRDALLAEQEAA